MKQRPAHRFLVRRIGILAACLALLTLTVSAGWQDWVLPGEEEEAPSSEEPADAPAGEEPGEGAQAAVKKLVAQTDGYALYYDERGADIYVENRKDGVTWSNAVDPAYYQNEDANTNMLSMLFQMSVADEKGELHQLQLFDAEANAGRFAVTPVYEDNGLRLQVACQEFAVAFDLCFALTQDGFTATIPQESLVQSGEDRLVNLTLMPAFGAAKSTQDGYIFFPDGCGALVEFDGRSEQDPRVYSYPIYGLNLQDIDEKLSREEQDIKNIMLPVYGIRSAGTGFLAAITEGEADSTLNVCPSGYQAPGLSRAYFTFQYMVYAQLELNGQTVQQLMPYSFASTKTVRYFLLDSQACEYSDMALAYRQYLEETGQLTGEAAAEPRMSIDFFGGIRTPGFWSDTFTPMTTYGQAQAILERLKEQGVENLEVGLMGWGKGGYDVLPTDTRPEGALGGKNGLLALADWVRQENGALYLRSNFVDLDTRTGSANTRKDVLRNYFGLAVTDESQTHMLLDVAGTFHRYVENALDGGLFGESLHMNLDGAGTWVISNFEEGGESSRQAVVEAYRQGMERLRQATGRLQVSGGNQYVLAYATSLRDIPDTTSGYFITTADVPFYQMVVSGHLSYTSVAGNQSYEYERQKLRWLEFGCTPYFVLTEENPLKIADSTYNTLFSTQADAWIDAIAQLYAEYTGELSAIAGRQLLRHTRLSDTLVQVDYAGGTRLYLNYADEAQSVDGLTVEPLSYRLVQTGT